jgi:glycosyltransferase involved in cell wall biosynthesis
MRILVLSQVLPYPLDSGPKVRSYFVIRHLSQNHQVTLLAFARPDDRREAIEHLRRICDVHTVLIHRSRARDVFHLAASMVSREAFVIRRDFVPEMAQKLIHLMQSGAFDAVHADQLWMAQYATLAKRNFPTVKIILDQHNAYYQIYQQLAQGEESWLKRVLLQREWRMVRKYEARACTLFNHVITVTDGDRIILNNLIREHGQVTSEQLLPKISTIPICIDTQAVQPVESAAPSTNVLHMGTMFWQPNIDGVLWFAREVWPRVLKQVPQATFTVVGKNPPQAVKVLADSASINVTGYVPDPGPYLEKAAAFIVPLLSGSGMRVKILDAWAAGLTVISTSIGAEGIKYQDGKNILIADGAESFAKAVIQVLHQPEWARNIAANGRQWVQTNYDWKRVYKAWDPVYRSVQA